MAVWSGRAESNANAIWRLLLRIALIAGLIYAGYRLRNVIITVVVAGTIAYVLDPLVEWLSRVPAFVSFHTALMAPFLRNHAPPPPVLSDAPLFPEAPRRVRMKRHATRVYATLYVFVLSVVVLWYGSRLIVKPFVDEFRAATSVEGRRQATETKEKAIRWYDEHAPDWIQSDKIEQKIRESNIADSLQQAGAEMAKRVLEMLKNVVEIVILPVLAFYFLIDGRKLKHEFISLAPRHRIRETLRAVNDFNRIMRAFVAGQFILCVLAGAVVGLGLALLQVKYPIILGVLAGITRAIPIIGPIIGGIPIILLTVATKGFGVGLAVLGFFTFLHFAESKFIMPLLIGDRMELHPVVIILVLLIGGEAGGGLIGGQIGALLGMFFAAPVASLARILVRRYWLQIHRHNGRPRRALISIAPASPEV